MRTAWTVLFLLSCLDYNIRRYICQGIRLFRNSCRCFLKRNRGGSCRIGRFPAHPAHTVKAAQISAVHGQAECFPFFSVGVSIFHFLLFHSSFPPIKFRLILVVFIAVYICIKRKNACKEPASCVSIPSFSFLRRIASALQEIISANALCGGRS